jgi:hypothetical protein
MSPFQGPAAPSWRNRFGELGRNNSKNRQEGLNPLLHNDRYSVEGGYFIFSAASTPVCGPLQRARHQDIICAGADAKPEGAAAN